MLLTSRNNKININIKLVKTQSKSRNDKININIKLVKTQSKSRTLYIKMQ